MMATKLTPRAKAEATGICQRDGSYCYAWKVHFRQEESGLSPSVERVPVSSVPASIPSALVEAVRPFVNAKLNRDFSRAIDITDHISVRRNASVRGITDEGVKVFFYSGTEIVPWETIAQVTVASLDDRGNRTSEHVVWPISERIAA